MQVDRNSIYSVIFFRFAIATVIFIVNTTLFGLGRIPVYFIITAIYGLTIMYSLLTLANIFNRKFLYVQIFLDLIMETLLVHYTGGVNSVLSILFPLSSIAASIIISPAAAIIIALSGSIMYAGIVTLESLNIFSVPALGVNALVTPSDYVFSLLYFRVTVFIVIGFLSSYIADQLRKQNKVVLSLQEKLRREDRLSAIGKLAASTAHEIRNPLASISGCVEALKDTIYLEAKDKKLFDLILKETARLNDIINGLLEYVKPRKLKLEKISVDELIDEVVFLLKSSKKFNQNIIIKKENSLPEVMISCDPQQIKQVLFNLLINAVEAVDSQGKIIIKQNVKKDIKGIELDIIDNGIGMSKEQLGTLFEPFSSGKDQGVGLGLPIVSTIIKEHGGTINIQSALGKGTTFSIFLPEKIKE
ncbi:MAG: GHKL domain-containing protein [Candidatus Omnitrophica bacterium]|nr:GHKL domain-containing protein [Candidatus Omnitrophota bacterium]